MKTFIPFFVGPALAIATWPNSRIDWMEELMFQQSGFYRHGFVDGVLTCGFSSTRDPGRHATAEWIRTAYHDMATADVGAGTGGLDGSIQFELDRDENVGDGLPDTLSFLINFYTPRSNLADLLALAVYDASLQCGGPEVPVRVGRIDATKAGPPGVPKPDQSLESHSETFAKQGFNVTDMIGLVACGHTLGGVHSVNFPAIVKPNTTDSGLGAFDTTETSFDHSVSLEYLAGTSKNPLVTGPELTNSDKRIFAADGNVTMKSLSDPTEMMRRCGSLLGRMIDTVPSSVHLSEPLQPYPVRPLDTALEISADGRTLTFSGVVRVLDSRRGTDNLNVIMKFKDRNGNDLNNTLSLGFYLLGGGLKDEFTFHPFNTTFSSETSISSFTVDVSTGSGNLTLTETFDNNGNGFPINDVVMFQPLKSCINDYDHRNADGSKNMTLVAAIHNSRVSLPVTANIFLPVPRNNTKFHAFVPTEVPMSQWKSAGTEYTLFRGKFQLGEANDKDGLRWDIVSGNGIDRVVDDFRSVSGVPTQASCSGDE